jgi:hypothetical protein
LWTLSLGVENKDLPAFLKAGLFIYCSCTYVMFYMYECIYMNIRIEFILWAPSLGVENKDLNVNIHTFYKLIQKHVSMHISV